jgi:hypothetical protein
MSLSHSHLQRYVEPLFIKRVAEAALEELVKRCVNMFLVGVPGVSELQDWLGGTGAETAITASTAVTAEILLMLQWLSGQIASRPLTSVVYLPCRPGCIHHHVAVLLEVHHAPQGALPTHVHRCCLLSKGCAFQRPPLPCCWVCPLFHA